jgi:uncharacterized protein (DUF2252 family)
LGLPRYVVLIRGSGRPDGAALVDLKCQIGSTLLPQLAQRQPRFRSEAERVVEIENRMQAVGPAFLTPVKIGGRSFTLRELQPSADKLDLAAIHPDAAALEAVVWSMGELTAWAQLRCAGRDGAATIDISAPRVPGARLGRPHRARLARFPRLGSCQTGGQDPGTGERKSRAVTLL